MKINHLSIIFFLICINFFGQNSIKFEAQYQPNKKYFTKIKSDDKIEMDFVGDSEMRVELELTGMKLPMITSSNSFQTYTIITDRKNDNDEIPIKFIYGDTIEKTIVEGDTIIEVKPLSGLISKGRIDKNRIFLLDSIIKEDLTPRLRKSLKTMLESFQDTIPFLDKTLNIGDTFDRSLPMTIPLEGIAQIELIINTTYLLTGIREQKAFFDLKQTVTLKSKNDEILITVDGSGFGKSEYDIKETYVTKMTTELNMNTVVNLSDVFKISIKSNTKSELNVSID